MKKFTIHLDAIILVVMLLVICIGSNIYQRKLHGDLHKKNIALIVQLTDTQLELINSQSSGKKCVANQSNG